jgi:hypothetical protein
VGVSGRDRVSWGNLERFPYQRSFLARSAMGPRRRPGGCSLLRLQGVSLEPQRLTTTLYVFGAYRAYRSPFNDSPRVPSAVTVPLPTPAPSRRSRPSTLEAKPAAGHRGAPWPGVGVLVEAPGQGGGQGVGPGGRG